MFPMRTATTVKTGQDYVGRAFSIRLIQQSDKYFFLFFAGVGHF